MIRGFKGSVFTYQDLFRFEESLDIKIFKKEDEPSAKSLTDNDLVEYKNKMEKEYEKKDYLFNSEEIRHMEARMESVSLKEQKER